ncbi:MAG TPA: hypothetical protein ENK66_05135 [Arcobacter sp.]|nr:hypothetical protein [Arcobacter sp.]
MKIDKLTLKNFKFFYGEKTLNFESKNVLLYGENGSGKSSIYWALYTLLNNAKSPDAKIQKYFNHREKNRLLNRYIEEADTGRVSITLVNGEEYAISNDSADITQYKRGTTLKEASIASDFINYKLLAKLYDFKHRQTIDLFELFESDIFSYLTYDTHRNYDNVWDGFLKKEKIAPRKWSNEYMTFTRDIDSFNTRLNTFLDSIIESTNAILQEHFYGNIKISFTYRPLEYDSSHDIPRYRELKNPKINITISLLNDNIPIDANRKIEQPHTFLNEAKLTAIALSIRLAILRTRISADVLKVLVLDDLLISLDMSNRDIVVNMLLEDEYLKDYHIIILTHDRAFYERSRQIFDYKAKNKWKYFEMYVDKKYKAPKLSFSSVLTGSLLQEKNINNCSNYIEVPYIKEAKPNLDKAKEHFKNKDYPACANYLRKEVEKQFDIYLQLDNLDAKINLAKLKENLHLVTDTSKDLKKLLRVLKQFENCERMPQHIQTQKCKEFSEQIISSIVSITKYIDEDFHFEEFEDVKLILKSILHPQSHSDVSKPLYKKELEDAIILMEAFTTIIEN